MARREKLFLESCLLHPFSVSLWFWTFLCYMLLKNACKNTNTDKNGPNMVPTPLQNRSWRGSGGLLGATLEARCFQDLTFDDFGSNLGPPFGTSLGSFWASFLLMFFWSGFLMALAFIWAPKTPPKWDPKGDPNQNLKIIDFATIYYTWATFEGHENHIFWVFLVPFSK